MLNMYYIFKIGIFYEDNDGDIVGIDAERADIDIVEALQGKAKQEKLESGIYQLFYVKLLPAVPGGGKLSPHTHKI